MTENLINCASISMTAEISVIRNSYQLIPMD